MKKKIIILVLFVGIFLFMGKGKQNKQSVLNEFVTSYLNSKADKQVELKDRYLSGDKQKEFRLEALKNMLTYNITKADTLNLSKGKLVAAFEAAENGYHLKANNRLSVYDNGLLVLRYNHKHYYLLLSANDIFTYQNYLVRLKDIFLSNTSL